MTWIPLKRIRGWVIFLLAALLLAGCAGNGTQAPQVTPTPRPLGTLSEKMMEARVVPVRSASLSFATQGVIEEVLVSEGQSVEAGQVLARLKGREQARAAVAQAEYAQLAAQQDLKRLDEKAKVEASEAQLALAKAKTELKDAQENRERMSYRPVTDLDLNTLHANYILAQDEFKTAEDAYNGVKDRPENDLTRAAYLSRLSAARQVRDQALYNYNEALKRPDENKVSEADARLALAKAAHEYAELRVQKLKNGPDPDALELAQKNLSQAQAQLAAAKVRLKDLELLAPFAGAAAAVKMEKGETTGLTPVVELADFSAWKIKTTDLTEREAVGIKPGDPARVTIDALPGLELAGKVSFIERYGLDQQGDILYTVTVDLDSGNEGLMWNMTAFVSIQPAP